MANDDYMLSIIYITKNRCDELKESILSCESHVTINHEYVVVDNGSQDATSDVVKSLKETGIAIQYLPQLENFGVAGGRNIGSRAAKGDILYFIDDDAIIASKNMCLDDAYRFLISHDDIYAMGTDIYDTERQKRLLGIKSKNRESGMNVVMNYIGCSHFVKKSSLSMGDLYPDNLIYGSEELYAALSFYSDGGHIILYDKVFVLHRPSSNTRTSRIERKREGYINTFVIKRYFLPRCLWIISKVLFCLRLFRFERYNIGQIISDYRVAISRYDSKYSKVLSWSKLGSLINEFGFLNIF